MPTNETVKQHRKNLVEYLIAEAEEHNGIIIHEIQLRDGRNYKAKSTNVRFISLTSSSEDEEYAAVFEVDFADADDNKFRIVDAREVVEAVWSYRKA